MFWLFYKFKIIWLQWTSEDDNSSFPCSQQHLNSGTSPNENQNLETLNKGLNPSRSLGEVVQETCPRARHSFRFHRLAVFFFRSKKSRLFSELNAVGAPSYFFYIYLSLFDKSWIVLVLSNKAHVKYFRHFISNKCQAITVLRKNWQISEVYYE